MEENDQFAQLLDTHLNGGFALLGVAKVFLVEVSFLAQVLQEWSLKGQ